MTDHESTITERVRRIVANHQGVGEDEIADDTPLFRNLASFDMEELIMAFEDEFGIRIPDGDFVFLKTGFEIGVSHDILYEEEYKWFFHTLAVSET